MNIGKNGKISPRNIVGAITNKTGISRKAVGKIDIYNKFTFVEVQEKYVERVISELKNIKIKGHKINIERANPKSR